MSARSEWLVRGTLLLGGADAIAGPLLIFFPSWIPDLLDVEVPQDIFYLWLFGLLATYMGVLHLLIATDPRRHYGSLIIVALMRVSIAVLVVYSIYGGYAPVQLIGFAVVDLALGSVFSAYAIIYGVG